jgi:hypothetical protein
LNADPDPAAQINADPDQDTDPDPKPCLPVYDGLLSKFSFLLKTLVLIRIRIQQNAMTQIRIR